MNLFKISRDELEGYLALLVGITLFSTVEVAVKLIGPVIPPLRLAFMRFMLTGLILLIPSIRTIRLWVHPPSFRDFGVLILLGVIGVTFSLGLYHLSLHYLQANVGAIVFSANPVFVALFAPFILGERPTWRKTIAVGLGLAGVCVFLWGPGQSSEGWTQGIFFMVGSMISFALYSVLSKKFMPRFGAKVITCFAGLFGGLLILPFSWVMEGAPFVAISMVTIVKLFYLSGIATVLAYILYFFGMVQVGASKGAMFFFLKPLLASICAYFVLGEQVTPQILIGGVVIMSALGLVVLPRAGS